MSDPTPPSPSPKRELALEISFWTLVVGGTLVSLIYDYPTLLLICSILFLYIAAVCLHEFGHAIGAFLMGGQVHYIQLGQRYSNKSPWQLSFLGFVWRIYSLPLSGALHSSFFTSDYYRTRRCVMIALGPIFNLLAVLGSAILLVNLELDHTTRTFTLLFGWMLVNGYLVFGSLPPQTILYRGKTHTNDGRLFLDTLFYTRLEIETIVDYANLSRNFSEEAQLAVSLTTPDLLAKCDTDPATPAYLWFAVLRLSQEKDPRHPEYLVRLVQRSDLPLENKTMAIDQFLTDQLHSGPPPDPALTDRLSVQLLECADRVTTRGTRGSVLIDLGRIEEGKAMLHEVLEKTSNDIDRTYSHIFLALAAKHEGNLELARDHAQIAAKIDPHSLALPRVSNLLSSPVTART